jgi:hypothetical protein
MVSFTPPVPVDYEAKMLIFREGRCEVVEWILPVQSKVIFLVLVFGF